MRRGQVERAIDDASGAGYDRHRARFALPFAVQCMRCHAFVAKYTRFNAYKETLKHRTYCGAEVYRFIIKCTGCRRIFTLLTDPEHGTYSAEASCFRVSSADARASNERSEEAGNPATDTDLQKLMRQAELLRTADLSLAKEAVVRGKSVQECRRARLLALLAKTSGSPLAKEGNGP
ncbi:hypothetical protein PAPHI01_0046 [Pancytospora philotis]|nr:hypothetical protein PAPHI01_0046 [Pancytospora philotis]